jgi:hypothetical protein
MTARLHVVDHVGPVDPVGAHMAEMVHLWAELVADGPPLTDCYGIVFGSYDRGQIEVSFSTDGHATFLAWAEHLGLAFKQAERFGGSSVLLAATGVVKRGQRSAHIHLRCATTDRGIA